MTPRITVIIPTRERGEVLEASLRSVMAQDYENLSILVSDNCSTDQTAEVVRAANDPRIRYINTGKRVSMSHNWEFALSHVNDGWVMIIGDDDALMPGALRKIAALASETGVKAINSTYCTFIWPNEENEGAGRLLVPMRSGYEIRNAKEWWKRVLDGRAWYSVLPILYEGAATHISLINEIRSKRGTFFQSRVPDVFSSIALSSIASKYVFSHEPLAVAGHSKYSNGASWNAAAERPVTGDRLKPKQMFLSEVGIPFHENIPLLEDGSFPLSADMLVYESYLQSIYIHGDPFSLKPEDMLPLFLARAIPDWKRMNAWVPLFVKQNNLDLGKAQSRASMLKIRVLWDRFSEYAAVFRDTYRIEPSFGLKIRDVYEASLVAATVLRTRPNRMKSYLNTINKWTLRRWRPTRISAVEPASHEST